MGRKSKKVVALLLALLMVFSVCSPVSGGTGLGSTSAKAGNSAQPATASDAEESEKGITPLANTDGLTLSDFEITVNGTVVKDDSNVKNGDSVGISFKWAIANNSGVKNFEVDLKSQGIEINDYAETVLYDESGKDVGTWYIQEGKYYITLRDEFLEESEINGWANIDGTVDFSSSDLNTEDKGKIKIGDASFTVNVDLNEAESYAGSNKSKGAVTWNPDGSITQSYEVTVTAYNGKVTLGDATETMGSALTNISNIQVNGTGYTSWSDAQAAMSGMVLDSKDESAKTAKITYDVTVSAADVKQAFAEGDVNIFDNKFSVKYKTNKDNDKDTGSVTTGLNIRKPSLSKNGTWNTDASGKKVISWTSGDKDSVKVYVTEKDGYQNFKYSFDEKGNLLVGGLFHDKEYTLTETRPADGYVTADAIVYQIKSVMASSVAEDSTDTVASGSAVTVNPVSGSAVSGETGISYTSVVAVKQKDGNFADHTDDKIIMVDEQTLIQLLKLDKETGQALGGAKFVVTDSQGNKVMKFVTKDDAYDITGKLVVGETYTFTEVSAPSGYQLAKPVQLTIKDTGKVQTVTVKDAPIPEVPDTPQTGGNMPIIPSAAGLLMVVGAAVMIWRRRTVVRK